MAQSTYYLSRAGPHPDLPAQGFASPEKVKEVHDSFKSTVRGEMEGWTKGLMRYLQDEETVRVLVIPAQVSSTSTSSLPNPTTSDMTCDTLGEMGRGSES